MNISFLALVLVSLATYALAYSGANLDGPFGLFLWVRGRFDPDERTWVGRGLNCPICQGFWWVWVVLALWWLAPPVVLALAAWGAVTVAVVWGP